MINPPVQILTRLALSAFASLLLAVPARANTPAQPYALEGTEVRNISSAALKRDYEIYVSLPPSYLKSQRKYPVVFVTDAPYAFPLLRSIGRRVNGHGGNMSEFILVGLAYAKGDDPVRSRNRDYTPSDIIAKKTAHEERNDGPYGQAEVYRNFVATEVMPFVARNYRADMGKKVYIGHSYGSLFGLHTLLTAPTMFDYYVLGSPSLWFDKRYMFDAEKAYAASGKDMPAKVMMVTGAFEALRPGAKDPRFNNRNDMVKDAQDFAKQLKSHRYPGLTLRSEILADEDHLTIFPVLATRGLMWALPTN
ncbi:alpha/beta hydrolase [Chitinimonas arctica]|nr:alpha/beta hydrolase-fold protein [Chitinimonas arctica]